MICRAFKKASELLNMPNSYASLNHAKASSSMWREVIKYFGVLGCCKIYRLCLPCIPNKTDLLPWILGAQSWWTSTDLEQRLLPKWSMEFWQVAMVLGSCEIPSTIMNWCSNTNCMQPGLEFGYSWYSSGFLMIWMLGFCVNSFRVLGMALELV